ncbi:MAG: Hsp20/alpha crystallin family protein [Nitrospirota bacterium]
MTLIRWDPIGSLVSLQERMNRLFEESVRRSDSSIGGGTWTPAVDIYETGKDIVISAELPGMSESDVDVEVRENVLTVKGERRFEREVKEENSYHRVERSYGKFSREFSLPKNVETEKITARFDKGVLEVRLPKAAESEARAIKIETKEKDTLAGEQSETQGQSRRNKALKKS